VQRAFRLRAWVVDEVRGAVAFMKGMEGRPQSVDRFMDAAAEAELRRLRDELRDGEPFEPVEGALPTTPPPGEVARISALGRKARAAKRTKGSE
jgi:hypothetical protein